MYWLITHRIVTGKHDWWSIVCSVILSYNLTAKARCYIKHIFNKLPGFPIILATKVMDMRADVGILF